MGPAWYVIDVRVASMEKCITKWDAKDRWAACAQQLEMDSIAMMQQSGTGMGRVLAWDAKAKMPAWIRAVNAHPRGFVMKREHGEANFATLDHDLPIAERMTMSTSGIVVCAPGGPSRSVSSDFPTQAVS